MELLIMGNEQKVVPIDDLPTNLRVVPDDDLPTTIQKKSPSDNVNPAPSTSDLQTVSEPQLESGEKVEIAELPKSYQYNRNNTSELEVGKTYQTTSRETKRWNGEYFEKNPDASPLKPLLDYSLKGVNGVQLVEKLDTLPAGVGDKKTNIAEAYRKTEDVQNEAAELAKQTELLTSFVSVQELNQLNEQYAKATPEQRVELQKQIDELAGKPITNKDFIGTRFSRGDLNVSQNFTPTVKAGQGLEEYEGEEPSNVVPEKIKTVGDAYAKAKQNEEFIKDVQAESFTLNSITKAEQEKLLEPEQIAFIEAIQDPAEKEIAFQKAVEESKTDAGVATSFLRGINHSMEGLFNAGKYIGMKPKDLESEMKREFYKEQLFQVKPEGIAARTSEGIGGIVPDIALSATGLGLTGMLASMSARHPNEALKQYYFDKFSKNERPDYNEALKFATASTAINAAVFGGAALTGKAFAPAISKTVTEAAINFLKGTVKNATKDAAIFGLGGKAIQDLNSNAFDVEHDNDYLQSAIDMGVFGGVMHTITHAPAVLRAKMGQNKINKAIDVASFLPAEITTEMVRDGQAKGFITPEQGEEILIRQERIRNIVNQFPRQLTLEQIEAIEPLFAEKEKLMRDMKGEGVSPTMKDIMKAKVRELDEKALIKGAVPLTGEEKSEYRDLISADAKEGGKTIDRSRLTYLRKRMEAASNEKEEAKIESDEQRTDTRSEGENETPAPAETTTTEATPNTETELVAEVEKPVEKVFTRAELAKARAQLLKKEPTSLREAILQWFVGGGKVNTADVKRYLGTRAKGDWQDLIGKHKNGGNKNSIDAIANQMFGRWMSDKSMDETAIANQIMDVIQMRKSDMEAELRGNKEQEDFYAENGITKEQHERLSLQESIEEEQLTPENEAKVAEIEKEVLSDADEHQKFLEDNGYVNSDGTLNLDALKEALDNPSEHKYAVMDFLVGTDGIESFKQIIENEKASITTLSGTTNKGKDTGLEEKPATDQSEPTKEVSSLEQRIDDMNGAKEKARNNPVGKEVSFKHAGQNTKGVVTGIDEKGNLLVTEKGKGKYPDTKHVVKPENATVVEKEVADKSGSEFIVEGWNEIKEALLNPTGTLTLNPKLVTGFAKIGYGLIKEGNATVKNVIDKIKDYIKANGGYVGFTEKDFKDSIPEIKKKIDELNQKSFLETVKDSPATSEEMAKKTAELDQFYETLHNKEALAAADKKIAEDLGKAKDFVMSDAAPSAEKSAMAVRLIKHFESVKDFDSAIEVLNAYDNQLRESGRFIQAASLWNRLDPSTIVRVANKEAKKLGQDLSPEVQQEILRRMTEVQELPEGTERDKGTLEVLNYIADQLPLSALDWFDAYRYQNMLSNPRSHERNIWGNLLNVFATEPASLAMKSGFDMFSNIQNPEARDAKFSQIPTYYKDALMNIPNAFIAAKETFRNGYVADKILDIGNTTSQIEALRRTKLPKYLTVVTRFLESQDRFFSVLIGQGEKMRLMRNGVGEADATARATKLAEEYLYREKLDPSDKSKPYFVRALDAMGQGVNQMRNLPVIGKPFSWFVPFVTTPINVAKMGVKFSPLGFVGGEYSKGQISNATLGTIMTGVGATMAMQGLTSWAAPKDKKERELFYASGRKPYSVKIGDKWVPMAYFGPMGLSLALPAAVKHFQEDTKTALTDNQAEKVKDAILSTSGFITSQTPLSSVDGFYKTIGGDEDYTVDKVLGYVTSQAIPLAGMLRYINTILDPVYRKSKGYWESIESGIPELSKELDPIKTPDGKDAEREPANALLPYDLGFSDKDYEILLKVRREKSQKAELKKQEEEGKTKGFKSPKFKGFTGFKKKQ